MLSAFQFVAIAIGAFYVFAGVVVLRAMALDRVMDQLLAALNDPAAPKEALKSRVLTVGGFLTLGSGVALALLSPLAAVLFSVNAAWQGGYLLWADRALPPEDVSEAAGRRQTKNAFVVYLAATAFVLWLASQGHLRAFDAPWAAYAIDAAFIGGALLAVWFYLHGPRTGRSSTSDAQPEADTELEPDVVVQSSWLVLRSDDAGNVYLVEDQLGETEAKELAASLTERGHKQSYTAHCYGSAEERAVLIEEYKVRV